MGDPLGVARTWRSSFLPGLPMSYAPKVEQCKALIGQSCFEGQSGWSVGTFGMRKIHRLALAVGSRNLRRKEDLVIGGRHMNNVRPAQREWRWPLQGRLFPSKNVDKTCCFGLSLRQGVLADGPKYRINDEDECVRSCQESLASGVCLIGCRCSFSGGGPAQWRGGER